MKEHRCKNKKWMPVAITDCLVCRPATQSAPGYLPEGYKESKQRTVKDSRGSAETLHWSGRQDVNIRPKAVPIASKTLRPV